MTGFDSEAYDRTLGFDQQGLQSTAIAAIGERSDQDQSAREPKVRRPREEIFIDLAH